MIKRKSNKKCIPDGTMIENEFLYGIAEFMLSKVYNVQRSIRLLQNDNE